ncbi:MULTISPECIES: DUF3072 domain-containing protein [unclassified Bradyrhizobium]|uniref:DUF3072 domain-containing protein n=1 Tax=unclassified Bradyrhizobium TaxID=2631580 RepID=UPI0029170797|nr:MULTISPECIES: DUF3072 domain-containing protein [unclassified Bradyrhizobium]
MSAMTADDGGLTGSLARPMTTAQAMRLKDLAEEACQPDRYEPGLTFEEAARRIDALKAEIALADSF